MKVKDKYLRFKSRTSLLIPGVIWFFIIAYIKDTGSLMFQQATLTVRLCLVGIILFTMLVIKEELVAETAEEYKSKTKEHGYIWQEPMVLKSIFFAISIALYLMLMPKLGFVIATILFVLIIMIWLGVRNKYTLVFLPIISSCILYYIFKYLLFVKLPVGILKYLI